MLTADREALGSGSQLPLQTYLWLRHPCLKLRQSCSQLCYELIITRKGHILKKLLIVFSDR